MRRSQTSRPPADARLGVNADPLTPAVWLDGRSGWWGEELQRQAVGVTEGQARSVAGVVDLTVVDAKLVETLAPPLQLEPVGDAERDMVQPDPTFRERRYLVGVGELVQPEQGASHQPDDVSERALFAISIRGGTPRQVTPTLYGIGFKHDWAPHGSRLVVSDNADDPDHPSNLVTIRPDGTGLRYLTHLQTSDQRALVGGYSPDGKWIIYRLEHGTHGQGDRTVLPFSSFRPRYIDWGPATK